MIYVFFFSIVSLILWGVFLTTGYLCYLVRHSNHSQQKYKVNPRTGPVSLCCVMGSGGHTMEMLELLKNLGEQYTPRCYIVADTDHMSIDKVREFENLRNSGTFDICTIPRSREVGQSFITAVPTTLYSFLFALSVVWKAKPDLLLVNGPGSCIPVVFAAALFDMLRLRDTIIIYEESICRVETLSLSGSILYFLGLADDIIVQWKQLKEKYPRTILITELE
ncbi:oligosaccharide biosynthesis protein Alg14 like protein [Ancylostoma caninum]|uniref:UDP-N-acetylglucosamine transferase subunit ALG14 n=1 Tax=Ancylostoma caninum TaxID=29170 RepID=A0A368GSW1_ANCCA|nr:oligosaccharide biosynthesis protein Alg14 like protein [Ancylostoma caninum]